MLAAGRISSTEFATLNSIVRGQRESVEEFRIPGNVELRITRNELEAASRVLNTPELLELILVHVPPADLLLRTRLVCTSFKLAVDATTSPRRKLFREPDQHERGDFAFLPFRLGRHGVSVFAGGWGLWFLDSQTHARLGTYPELLKVLMVQPPVMRTNIHVCFQFVDGACRDGRNETGEGLARPDASGVTIGDVLELLGRLHRLEWGGGQANAWKVTSRLGWAELWTGMDGARSYCGE